MRWLSDENFDNDIVRGVLRRSRGFDIVRVQDIDEISGQTDVVILAWATTQDRVVLTHDLSTMIPAMHEQRRRAPRCAPIVLVPDSLPTGSAIEEILLLDQCSIEADWAAAGRYRGSVLHSDSRLPAPDSLLTRAPLLRSS